MQYAFRVPIKKNETYTTVAAPQSSKVHAVSLKRSDFTLCGRRFSGWRIVPANPDGHPKRLSCDNCKLAIIKGRVER